MDSVTKVKSPLEEVKQEVKTSVKTTEEQAKVDLRLKQQEDATTESQRKRALGTKKVRMGTAGKRSLMTSGFKGIAAEKSATLG